MIAPSQQRTQKDAIARGRTGGEATAEQARLVEQGLVRDCHNRVFGHDGVLGEGTAAHEVKEGGVAALEARGLVGHEALALRRADGAAQVRLSALTELALAALGRVELQGRSASVRAGRLSRSSNAYRDRKSVV